MEHEQVFIAPWSNIEELKEVYKNIFSKNYPEKQIALEQICVWRTRCYPALPTAVEATDLLTRAMVQDMIHQAEKGNISKKDITMMYCTAIVRFVNLTLEHFQTGLIKRSLNSLAIEAKMPQYLVDVRNEATHTFCPSLDILRTAAESSLAYLEETFWKIIINNCQPMMNQSSDSFQDNNLLKRELENFRTEIESGIWHSASDNINYENIPIGKVLT
ncbi:unnamed protein product [Larinioides sclopetarius]|uniref:Uncharacterized protein n=1 Tax=Larinioides sclopetarius TaxID=280406 RepID=A0AAV2AP11_9ARAC